MRCTDALDALFAGPAEAEGLEEHLASCVECRAQRGVATALQPVTVLAAPSGFVASMSALLKAAPPLAPELSCDEAEVELGTLLDGELGPELEDRVILHLAGCDACSRELAQLKELCGLVAGLPRLTAGADFATTVAARLGGGDGLAAEELPEARSPLEFVPPPGPRPSEKARSDERAARLASPWASPWLRAAAAVLLLGLIAVSVTDGVRSPTRSVAQLEATRKNAPASSRAPSSALSLDADRAARFAGTGSSKSADFAAKPSGVRFSKERSGLGLELKSPPEMGLPSGLELAPTAKNKLTANSVLDRLESVMPGRVAESLAPVAATPRMVVLRSRDLAIARRLLTARYGRPIEVGSGGAEAGHAAWSVELEPSQLGELLAMVDSEANLAYVLDASSSSSQTQAFRLFDRELGKESLSSDRNDFGAGSSGLAQADEAQDSKRDEDRRELAESSPPLAKELGRSVAAVRPKGKVLEPRSSSAEGAESGAARAAEGDLELSDDQLEPAEEYAMGPERKGSRGARRGRSSRALREESLEKGPASLAKGGGDARRNAAENEPSGPSVPADGAAPSPEAAGDQGQRRARRVRRAGSVRPPKVRKQEGLADAPGPSKQSAELEGSTKLLAGAVEKSRLGRQRSAPDAVPFAPEVEAPAPDAKGAGSVASPPAPAKGWKGRIKGQGEAREAKAERSKSAPPRSASEAERGVAETGNSLAPSSSPAKDEEGAEDGRMAAASSEDLGPVDLSLRGGRSLSGQLVYRDAARLILLVEGGQMVVVARAEVTRVERGAPGQGDASAKRRRVTILLLPEQGSEAGR